MAWKDRFKALKPSKTDVTINNETFRIYPMSGGLMFETQDVLIPLFNSLGHFFSTTKNDIGMQQRSEVKGEGAEAVVIEEQWSTPITKELAELRSKQRDMAMMNFITALLSPKTRDLVERVIKDALPEEFPRDARAEDQPKPGEVIAFIGLEGMVEILKGVWKANEKLLRPLMAAMAPGIENVKGRMESTLAAKAAEQSEKPKQPQSPSTTIASAAGTSGSVTSSDQTPPSTVTGATASGQPAAA